MHKSNRPSIWLASVLLLMGHCLAQHMNANDGPCQASASGAEATACFDSAFKKSDAELNQFYRRVQTAVDGDELARLKTAQRLWIQFRDANCSAESELYAGGSARPMLELACLEAVTRHRSEELSVMYGWRLEKRGK
jgi:uncharacterized protein YecT (DUF1311 family)